jgi:hypothetical protein
VINLKLKRLPLRVRRVAVTLRAGGSDVDCNRAIRR